MEDLADCWSTIQLSKILHVFQYGQTIQSSKESSITSTLYEISHLRINNTSTGFFHFNSTRSFHFISSHLSSFLKNTLRRRFFLHSPSQEHYTESVTAPIFSVGFMAHCSCFQRRILRLTTVTVWDFLSRDFSTLGTR